MNNFYAFTVPGKIVGKQRPFVTKSGQTFTPSNTAKAEGKIALFAKDAGVKPIEGAVSLTIECWFVKPKSWSKKKCSETHYCTTRPDADNITKTVADALNGIAFHDDSQVSLLTVKKIYGTELCTKIIINSLGG